MEFSQGQTLALHQLADIAAASNGALEVLGEPEKLEKSDTVRVFISLSTNDYPRDPSGLKLRDREKLEVYIHPDFPFDMPSLWFAHKRHIGAPHVQWGSYACLYQSSETEWVAADGLYGFFNRIDVWMRAAALGQLDPEDAPLHPPANSTSSSTQFVINENAPSLSNGDTFWVGRSELNVAHEGQYHLDGWTSLDDWNDVELPENIAAALLLNAPLPIEYPDKINVLVKALEKAGVPFSTLYHILRLLAITADRDKPAYLVLGAPMRRRAAGEPLKQHLTVWEITKEAVNTLQDLVRKNGDDDQNLDTFIKWVVTADVRWCQTFENREEVTYRRDVDSVMSSLRGKRVLLLGCGALGSVIGNHIVRSGAAALALADYGDVKPGLLVRQQFKHSDIGKLKTHALAEALGEIGGPTAITKHPIHLGNGVAGKIDLQEFDLVIDATASNKVSHRIERETSDGSFTKPLISMSVSAGAEYGSVSVKMPAYRLGPIGISRLSAIETFRKHRGHPATEAFWPKEPPKPFQPEPGCSNPTFRASAADAAAHASSLLNIGLSSLAKLKETQASLHMVGGAWLLDQSPLIELTFDDPARYDEKIWDYSVTYAPAAKRSIKTEMNRIARVRSDKVETGGLLFGEIDEGHGHIYIDGASGPPSDSEASAKKFVCGTKGTKELAQAKARQSGKRSRFLGIWHTHPVSPGKPSEDDMMAMVQLLHLQEQRPRQVLMLIIGTAATDPKFNHYLFRRENLILMSEAEYTAYLAEIADA